MKEAIVKVCHLSHRYSVQWAVKDISFDIPAQGIYGLLGSNGCGEIHRDEYHMRGAETN